MPRYRVGIDTGGTFTDVVAVDHDSGLLSATKTPSSPDDPSRSLAAGLDKILHQVDASRPDLESLIHGTTVATNALLEERFSSLALITTTGFRNILEIARQSVPSGYGNSYFWVKPQRIVPLELVFEVSERLNFRGEVMRPLDEDSIRVIAAELRARGVTSAAVCLIHAYANPEHEQRVARILAAAYPELVVSLSSDVLPEYREYERTMTTCVDAYVKPVMKRYIDRAVEGLGIESRASAGNGSPNGHTPFLIMQSNGGMLSAGEVASQPITTLLSGPAAGALGAGYLAGLAGYDRVLTVDAGGTSTDICLVDGGVPHVTTEGRVGRFPVKVPMVDITTIGTGGGSIVWIDPGGGLRVGPKSAGADPGPICYCRGGVEPTLTDANVALGRLPPFLLGGEMQLDAEAASDGLGRLARRLGLTAEKLAAGAVEIADWNQVHAIRQVTVKKGLDPRSYTMVAFGGSGPLQAPNVAGLLGIDTVLIPPNPGNVSAFGLLAVDFKADFVVTSVHREDRVGLEALNQGFSRLEQEAVAELEAEGVPSDRRRMIRSADLRYLGEAYEVRVDAPEGEVTQAVVKALTGKFHSEHERLYGYSYRGEQLCEIVNLRVSAIGVVDRPKLQSTAPPANPLSHKPAPASPDRIPRSHGRVPGSHPGDPSHGDTEHGPGATAVAKGASPQSHRQVHLGQSGFGNIPVYARNELASGQVLRGPAVVEEYGSTSIVPPGWSLDVDGWRNLILRNSP